jgi:hypothetical protein
MGILLPRPAPHPQPAHELSCEGGFGAYLAVPPQPRVLKVCIGAPNSAKLKLLPMQASDDNLAYVPEHCRLICRPLI